MSRSGFSPLLSWIGVAMLVIAGAAAAQAPDARRAEVRALIARASLPQLTRADFRFESGGKPFNLAATLRAALAAGNVHDAVAAAEPLFTLHQRLEDALGRYRALAAEPLPPLPELPKGTRKVEPGGVYGGVA